MLIDNRSKELSKENTQRVLKENPDKTVKHLTKMGKKVIILGQVPRLDKTICANKGPLKCIRKKATPLQKIIKIDDKKCVEADTKISTDRIEYAHQVIKEVSLKYKNAEFFDPKPYFFDERLCYAERDGKVVYRDDDHLNFYGGHYLGRKLMLNKFKK